MATRTIVTFHPDVPCDVCGRRLLRGEQPDVFLSGGQRRMVCELCTPRATNEGWRRETEEPAAAPRSKYPQRGRSLLDRLRQSRWSSSDRPARPVRAPAFGGGEAAGADEWSAIGRDWVGADDDNDDNDDNDRTGADRTAAAAATRIGVELTQAGEGAPGDGALRTDAAANGGADGAGRPGGEPIDVDAGVRWALEVFNAGREPRRIAGVARSLGPPCVNTVAVTGRGEVVSIVVAWELCWYRYEIDLHDETAETRLAAEGMELDELSPRERTANASADERGELSLLNA